MGAYDEVVVEHESMPKKWRGVAFQTKDLYKAMEAYKVAPSGKMYRKHAKTEFRDDPKSFFGCSVHVLSTKWLRKTDLEGPVEIHTLDRKLSMVQYLLSFHRGELVGLKRLRAKKKGS